MRIVINEDIYMKNKYEISGLPKNKAVITKIKKECRRNFSGMKLELAFWGDYCHIGMIRKWDVLPLAFIKL